MKQRFKFTPAVYLVLRKGDQILLSRRFNTGYQDGMYSMIAGHLDGDEPMTSAMAREAYEEAGITVNPTDLRLVHVMHLRSEIKDSTDDERATFYFETTEFKGVPRIMEPEKCDDMQWFKADKLPETMIGHVRLAVENINKGEIFSTFGW